jgi:hypothetical protein
MTKNNEEVWVLRETKNPNVYQASVYSTRKQARANQKLFYPEHTPVKFNSLEDFVNATSFIKG